eukprot:NODE_872_length_2723_cov_15.424114.p1 GENE.NODE_872_length_2723_cov_15.424114~~NODE_872_length_2723_cov_15.424114.p1  ORF type:complete len:825 (+),score=208.20 NODE_872_length_2723_cov_15.424114:359-2476(+)
MKLYHVYQEQVFVCLVTDLYTGGDLIVGMQECWKKGPIPMKAIPHVVYEMMSGVAWLHQNNTVHRDVKGDNYLMGNKNLTDPQMHIVLSDFGTVCDCLPTTRLKEAIGTDRYWPPEFYNKDYSQKVDVWAVGVVVCGLVDGKFPFNNKAEVNRKSPKLSKRCHQDARDFIDQALKKAEKDRPEAAALLKHKWLSGEGPPEEPPAAGEEETFTPEIKESGANAGLTERRKELIARLEVAKQKREQRERHGAVSSIFAELPPDASTVVTLDKFAQPRFIIAKNEGKYEWQTEAQMRGGGNMLLTEATIGLKEAGDGQPKGSLLSVKQMLENQNIDTSAFGTGSARTLEDFHSELWSGSSRLMQDAAQFKAMVRVVDLVLLRLIHGDGSNQRCLIKVGETLPSGEPRKEAPNLPGGKKEPFENTVQVALRVLAERMDLTANDVVLNFRHAETFEREEQSASYPGVRTVYNVEVVPGRFITTNPEILKKVGITAEGATKYSCTSKQVTRSYEWWTEPQCTSASVKLRAPVEEVHVSALVLPTVAIDQAQLEDMLATARVDVSRFGKHGAKSVQEFFDELLSGEASLERAEDNTLRRNVDLVTLHLVSPDNEGMNLAEVGDVRNGKASTFNRLPATKRRPGENYFLAAQRIMKNMGINPNFITIHRERLKTIEEHRDSKGYPGIETYYTKHIVYGVLLKHAEINAMQHKL